MPNVNLRTVDGVHYVCAENGGGGEVNANRTWAREWETFAVATTDGHVLTGGSSVYILSYDSHFLCAENGGGGEVNATRTSGLEWETFRLERQDGGTQEIGDQTNVCFRTWDGHWLTAQDGGGGSLNAMGTAPGPWQTFTYQLASRPVFPIHAERDRQNVAAHPWFNFHYMTTILDLSSTGRMNATTTTRDDDGYLGFHGAVAAFLMDENDNNLANTPLHGPYGVDGRLVPLKPSERTDIWQESFNDRAVLDNVQTVKLLQVEAPRNQLYQDVQTGLMIAKAFSEIVGIFKRLSDTPNPSG